MLARHFRLRRTQDFQAARQRGNRYRTELLILNVLPNDLPHDRFGFVVGKAIGHAVARNLVKRRLRAAASELLPYLQPGFDIVVVARQGAATTSYRGLRIQMQDLLTQAKLYKQPSD